MNKKLCDGSLDNYHQVLGEFDVSPTLNQHIER